MTTTTKTKAAAAAIKALSEIAVYKNLLKAITGPISTVPLSSQWDGSGNGGSLGVIIKTSKSLEYPIVEGFYMGLRTLELEYGEFIESIASIYNVHLAKDNVKGEGLTEDHVYKLVVIISIVYACTITGNLKK